MKKYIPAVLVLGGIIILFANSNTSKDPNIIKIGLVGPFSGNTAFFGEYVHNGIELAFSELPKEDQAKIQVIKEDDTCKAQGGINAVRKLLEIDKVKYVIGPVCNESTLATKDLFIANNALSLTTGLPSSEIVDLGPHHFSFAPEIRLMMKRIAEEMLEKGYTRVGILYINTLFEQENLTHFSKHYTEGGGTILITEGVERGSLDFRSQILKIKNAQPDSLLLISHNAELVAFLTQLSELELDSLPKYGIHAAESPTILKTPNLAEGLIYPYPAQSTNSQSAIAFEESYKEKFGTTVNPYSSTTYDSFKLLMQALKECDYNYENVTCTQEHLTHIKDFPGSGGLLSVDAQGVGSYGEIMLKTIKDGEFVKLEE